MWIFFISRVGKKWIEKKKLQKRGKVRESWEKEEGKESAEKKRGWAGNEDIGGKRGERAWSDEKGKGK